MDIGFSSLKLPKKGAVAVPVGDKGKLSGLAADLDTQTNGTLAKAIKQSEFKGKKGSTLVIIAPAYTEIETIVLFGVGGEVKSAYDIQTIGAAIYSRADAAKLDELDIVSDFNVKGYDAAEIAAHIAAGVKLKSYRFEKYFTKKNSEDDEDEKRSEHLEDVNILADNVASAKKAFATQDAIIEGVFEARDLVTEPPNILNPETYAERCKELKSLGIKVEVLGEKEMEKLGMGSLLGVGQGSLFESQLVVMQWNGAGKSDQPVAFVGKGVTFDTGGISIKPSARMEEMKYDMGGSAAVVGAMKALAGRKAKVNAVGVIGLVENMPGGEAQRPSDVVTSMSGQTIEVLNTDAEGRLVLADALWYTQDRFKPQFMVNLATLTGAIVVTLADQYAGLFSNDDTLSKRLSDTGEKVSEKLWRLPLGKEFDKMIDSKIADMQNIGDGRGAGSITAAQFLQRFVNDTPWAHLDIAGMAWCKKPIDVTPEGGSGFGVRLLNQLVADYYES